MIRLEGIRTELPGEIELLRAAVREEGLRSVERLLDEWATGTTRFEHDGEALLGARVGGVLAGIGGLTRDPVLPGALRMRRFYVRPEFRRCGLGRALAAALLDYPIHRGRIVTVNATTPNAAAFWGALSFAPDPHDGHTYILRCVDGP